MEVGGRRRGSGVMLKFRRMRATLASAALAGLCCLSGQAARQSRLQSTTAPDANYAAIIETYCSGDAEAAVFRLGRLDAQSLEAGFKAFFLNPQARLVDAAGAVNSGTSCRSPHDRISPVCEGTAASGASVRGLVGGPL